MRSITKITLDTVFDNAVTIAAKQGDERSRFLFATITDNGKELYVSPESIIRLNAFREIDSMSNSFIGTDTGFVRNDGTVQVLLDPWIVEKTGMVYVSISLIGDDSILTTRQFSIYVEPQEHGGSNISPSTPISEFTALVSEIARVKSRYNNLTLNQDSFTKEGDVYKAIIEINNLTAGDCVLFYPCDNYSQEYINKNEVHFSSAVSLTDESGTCELFSSAPVSADINVAYRVLRGAVPDEGAGESVSFIMLGGSSTSKSIELVQTISNDQNSIPSAKAVKQYVDARVSNALTDDIKSTLMIVFDKIYDAIYAQPWTVENGMVYSTAVSVAKEALRAALYAETEPDPDPDPEPEPEPEPTPSVTYDNEAPDNNGVLTLIMSPNDISADGTLILK